MMIIGKILKSHPPGKMKVSMVTMVMPGIENISRFRRILKEKVFISHGKY